MESTIDRETGDTTKGFRFQKLRASGRLLEKITAVGGNRLSCGIEFLEDSFLSDETDEPSVSVEENKLYTSSLTFNSPAVKNTVVAFIDLRLRYAADSAFNLCFFASATVGNERPDKAVLVHLDIADLDSCTILKKLCAKEVLNENERKICHYLIQEEYKKQYKDGGGFLEIVQKWGIEETLTFVSNIEWHVTTEANEELEQWALDQIRKCPYFTSKHEDLEAFILAAIMDLFEKLSEQKVRIARLVHASDVALIYNKILGDRSQLSPIDPAYKTWLNLDSNDYRNLRDKVISVSPDYLSKGLDRLERRCALAKYEGDELGREYVSLRRRLFDVCENVLQEHLKKGTSFSANEIDEIISEMTDRSMQRLAEIKRSFRYQIEDREIVWGAVLSLFDECYLAFDEMP